MSNNDFIFPIPVSRLFPFLPHRPPMVWIDEVLWVSKGELSGECCVYLESSGHYFGPNQTLRQSSFLEWMAQSYGYVCAARMIIDNIGVTRTNTFMAAVKNLEFLEDSSKIKALSKLKIYVELIRELGPMSLVSAKVTSDCGKITYAKAQLKLFAN